LTTSDLCVFGAGPAGCVLAARLAQFGLSVCLVERMRFPRRHLGESLSPGVLPLLVSIGAGPAIDTAAYPRVRKIHVRWEKDADHEDTDVEGLVVDRGHFDRLLLDHARACGVRVFQPATVHKLERRTDGWSVAVSGEDGTTELAVRLVADATGRAGVLPRCHRQTGPKTVALHAYWSGAGLPVEPRIEAGTNAWFWGVLLPDGLYNTLVFLDPHDLRQLPGTLDARFHALLSTSALLPSGSNARLVSKVHVTDATSYLDEQCVSADSIKVGDAALAIDPLSSSGVQKAIQTALAGSVAVNTLLKRPESRALAQRFYRENLGESCARHQAWARGDYARVAAVRNARFWRERAAGPPASEAAPPEIAPAMPPEAGIQLSPEARFVDIPCIVDRFIEARQAVCAPSLNAPVAFLGEQELVPLLECVRPGMSTLELLQAWRPRVPSSTGLAIQRWLVRRNLLVPATKIGGCAHA
jgi:flavin-dependent dehydrogenase